MDLDREHGSMPPREKAPPALRHERAGVSSPRGEDGGGGDSLSAYLRSIGQLEVLSPAEVDALAEVMEREEVAFRAALLEIPGTALALFERWQERRESGLVTGLLAARCRDGSGHDWSRHIDRTLGTLEPLLEERRALRSRKRPSLQRLTRLEGAIAARVSEADVGLEVLLEIHRRFETLLVGRRAEVAEEKRRLGLDTPSARASMQRAARALEAYHAAKQRFVRHNLRLVVSVAKRYRNMGIPFTDLLQEGNLGLIRAVEKYDRQRGYRFSTYAVWWITQALIRAIQNHSRTVRTPSHVYELRYSRRRVEEELRQRLGRDPTRQEVVEALDVTPETLQRSEEAMLPEKSLHAVVRGSEDRTLEEVLEDPDVGDPTEGIEHEQVSHRIEREMAALDERERRIIELRFGLRGQPTLTLEEIGKRLGISRERVRQIEGIALRRLRERDEIRELVA